MTTTALSTSMPMPTIRPSRLRVLSVVSWIHMKAQVTMREKGMQSTEIRVVENLRRNI